MHGIKRAGVNPTVIATADNSMLSRRLRDRGDAHRHRQSQRCQCSYARMQRATLVRPRAAPSTVPAQAAPARVR